MIVVDTNVLSEPLKPEPDDRVLKWLDRQAHGSLRLTSTVLSEVLFGIERLPVGQRKTKFGNALEALIVAYFPKGILPFDETAARIFAKVVAAAAHSGKSIQVSDGQIASIALAYGFAVATRDVAPFDAAGVKVINPWED